MSFEEIYEAHKKQVYNLALHYAQNVEDAQEISQDVFVTIYQSLHTFENRSKLSTWIYRITINKSLDFIKAKSRKKRFGFLTGLFYPHIENERPFHINVEHPGVLMEQKEAVKEILELINQLPANQKTVLILSKIEHKSQNDIAEIMNLSSKAVESLLQRAKNNLLKKIQNTEGK